MDITEKILKSSVKMNGDGRFFSMLEKMRQDTSRQYRLVFSGGSITAGLYEKGTIERPYTKIIADKLRSLTGADITAENIGVSAFHSALGVMAYEMLFCENPPDMVFLEFAVNNSFDRYNADHFESFIRKILSADSDTAVGIICCCRSDGFTCEAYMSELAEYYHIPCVSLKTAAGYLNDFSEYSSDGLHPHEEGHRLIAELASQIFISAENAPTYLFPEKYIYGSTMQNTCYFGSDNFSPSDLGDFVPCEMDGIFSRGWHYGGGSNLPMRFEISKELCRRALYIVFSQSDEQMKFGCADIYVNGDMRCSLDGYSIFGRDTPSVFGVYLDENADNHIEIKMHRGDENKAFDIFCFGI